MKRTLYQKITIVAILTALSVVLRIFALGVVSNNRIIFHNIPLILVGLYFGPLYGAFAGFICDLSSIIYQPGWNPIFIVSTVMWGLLPGLLRNFLNFKKIKKLAFIEIITHIVVSVLNTIFLGLVMGFDVAFGTIKIDKSYSFIITLFEHEFLLFHIGDFLYLRIIMVILIMIVKIPLDILIINLIIKRKIIPLEVNLSQGLSYVKKI